MRNMAFSMLLGCLLTEMQIQISFALLVALQATLVALASADHTVFQPVLVASSALQMCAAVSLGLLSHWEHQKSVRPSIMISTYLTLTSVLDVARVRTQALIPGQTRVVSVLIATLAVKLLALVVEIRGKTSILLPAYTDSSAELNSNIFSRALFLWLNPLLLMGSHNIIFSPDLPGIHEKLSSETLAARVQSDWENSKLFSKRMSLRDSHAYTSYR